MGFVRTKEEIARIQEALHEPRFVNSEMLRVNSEGAGLVRLGHSMHDSPNEIEVVKVLGGGFVEGDLIAGAETVAYISAEPDTRGKLKAAL